MGTYDDNKSLFGKLLTWFFVALLVIAALKLSFWVVGVAFGLGSFLLFTIGPILLVGWLAMKIIRYLTKKDPYDPA